MTDEQLVHYVEDRANKAYSEGYNKALNESSPNTIDWDEIKALMLRVKGIGVVKADAAVSLIRGAIDG